MTFWMAVLGSFLGGFAAGGLMEMIREWNMARRMRQAERYMETLRQCDMMLQDCQSTINALSRPPKNGE